MQNRYVGDIGDYIKYALLRTLSSGHKLGLAWYLFPDEGHNEDGKHILYLSQPKKWQNYDPFLFRTLNHLVTNNHRSVSTIKNSGIFPNALFSDDLLSFENTSYEKRATWRQTWFDRTICKLKDCDIVFADPDNGPKLDDRYRSGKRLHWKNIPLREILSLAANQRTVVVYFHNTRRKGGHVRENREWLKILPKRSAALYCKAFSCRTFFIIHPTKEINARLKNFAQIWGDHVELIEA